MSEHEQDKDRAGLGKVVYRIDVHDEQNPAKTEHTTNKDVQEADEESFPASDPPGFAGGSGSDTT